MKDHHFGRYEERRWRPIVWTSELEVGVETIDKAHRELIELYNAVREAVSYTHLTLPTNREV